MKNFEKVLSLVLLIGLFSIQSALALTCLPHQVKTGETVMSIAKQYSANPDKLIIRKFEDYRTVYLDQKDQLVPGETVYIVKEKIHSFPKATKVVSSQKEQPSPVVAQEKTSPTVASHQAPIPVEKEKGETGVKTDWGKAFRNWDANVGAYVQKDLDGGSGDNAERSGKGFHGSFGVFPWEVETENRKWKFGPKIRYNQGESSVEKPGYQATYDYKRFEAGLRAETQKNDQLFGVGAGVSFQETKKEASTEKQDTWSVHLRTNFEDESRRMEDEKFLPFVSGSLHHRQQISAKAHGGAEKYDETITSAEGRLAIVDLKSEKDDLRLTPEVLGELGYSQGKDSGFWGIGGGLSVGNKKSDYLQVGAKPQWYLQDEGSSRMTFFLNLNPDAIVRAAKASGVKKYDGQTEEINPSPQAIMEGR